MTPDNLERCADENEDLRVSHNNGNDFVIFVATLVIRYANEMTPDIKHNGYFRPKANQN